MEAASYSLQYHLQQMTLPQQCEFAKSEMVSSHIRDPAHGDHQAVLRIQKIPKHGYSSRARADSAPRRRVVIVARKPAAVIPKKEKDFCVK